MPKQTLLIALARFRSDLYIAVAEEPGFIQLSSFGRWDGPHRAELHRPVERVVMCAEGGEGDWLDGWPYPKDAYQVAFICATAATPPNEPVVYRLYQAPADGPLVKSDSRRQAEGEGMAQMMGALHQAGFIEASTPTPPPAPLVIIAHHGEELPPSLVEAIKAAALREVYGSSYGGEGDRVFISTPPPWSQTLQRLTLRGEDGEASPVEYPDRYTDKPEG